MTYATRVASGRLARRPRLVGAASRHQALVLPQRVRDELAALKRHLDCTGLAVIVLGGSDRVLFASRAARLVLARADGLIERDGRLAFLRKSDADRWLAMKCGRRREGLLTLPRSSGRRAYRLLLTVPPDTSRCGSVARCLTVVDLEHEFAIEPGLLELGLGLSHSESRVVAALARGHSVATVAAELRLSSHTVRSHLKRIFARCHVHSRAELMWLVGQLAAFDGATVTSNEGVEPADIITDSSDRLGSQVQGL